MREFSVPAYKLLARATKVPLLVAETSDGAHVNSADFIAQGTATFWRPRLGLDPGGITGSLRIAHLADAFRLRAEVLGGDLAARHLCMAIPNTTYNESPITSLLARRAPRSRCRRPAQGPGRPGDRAAARTRIPSSPVGVFIPR
jgi:L-alanine-DL-glutamate epimerase-like enolase superfamily enzyme